VKEMMIDNSFMKIGSDLHAQYLLNAASSFRGKAVHFGERYVTSRGERRRGSRDRLEVMTLKIQHG
jgi:uncharacterized membrane protein